MKRSKVGKNLVYLKSKKGSTWLDHSDDGQVAHNVHCAYGKAGRGQMLECLLAMAKYISSTREGILSVLLTAGFSATKTMLAIVGSHET